MPKNKFFILFKAIGLLTIFMLQGMESSFEPKEYRKYFSKHPQLFASKMCFNDVVEDVKKHRDFYVKDMFRHSTMVCFKKNVQESIKKEFDNLTQFQKDEVIANYSCDFHKGVPRILQASGYFKGLPKDCSVACLILEKEKRSMGPKAKDYRKNISRQIIHNKRLIWYTVASLNMIAAGYFAVQAFKFSRKRSGKVLLYKSALYGTCFLLVGIGSFVYGYKS